MDASNKIEKTLAKRIPHRAKPPDRFNSDGNLTDNFSMSGASKISIDAPESNQGRRSINKHRIETAKSKIERIHEIKEVIDKNMKDITASKPIVIAKWQPPLPT